MDDPALTPAAVDAAKSSASPDGPRRKSSRLRRWLSAVISLAIVIGIFWFFLPQFADISQVWSTIRAMTAGEVALLAVAAAWNLLTYCFVLLVATPGLTLGQAFVITQSSTAVSNTLPAGSVVGIGTTSAMYYSWGFSASRITVSVLLCGLWSNFVKLGLPVFALALLALQGDPGLARVIAALLGFAGLAAVVIVLGLILRSEDFARRAGLTGQRWVSAVLRRFGRPPVTGWDKATTKFRARTILLLRRRWHWLTLATLVSHLSLFAVLLLSLRAVGVSDDQVTWVEALAIFAFARLVTAIPITPGGLGIVELALIAGLVAAGGSADQVTAGVLVYRVLTYVLPIPLGLLTYVYWRRNSSWRRAPNAAPRTPLVPEQV